MPARVHAANLVSNPNLHTRRDVALPVIELR